MQTLTALAIASLVLLPPSPKGDALTWNPEEGTQLRRSVEINRTSTVEEATLGLMGDEQDVGSGMERQSLDSMVVLDRFGTGGDGRPAAIQREFEGVTEESESDGAPDSVQVRESDGSSGVLAGSTVDFAWDDGEWSAAWGEDSEGEASWLEGLQADMDFAAFLPEEEVAEGDRWEIDLASTQALFAPGGKVFVSEPEEREDLPEGGVAILIPDSSGVRRYDELDGSLEARYMGQREEGGRRVGVIAIELELEGALGVAEDLSRIIREDNGKEQMFDDAELHRSLTGKGEILWDLEGHHLASMSFEAEFESDLESAWEVSAGDMALSCEYHSAFGGQIKTSMSVERVTE